MKNMPAWRWLLIIHFTLFMLYVALFKDDPMPWRIAFPTAVAILGATIVVGQYRADRRGGLLSGVVGVAKYNADTGEYAASAVIPMEKREQFEALMRSDAVYSMTVRNEPKDEA